MKIIKSLAMVFTSTVVVACTATAPKAVNPAAADTETVDGSVPKQTIIRPAPRADNNQIASPDDISRLQAQVTALQEQLIKVTSDTGAILKLSQILIANNQVQSASSLSATDSQVNSKKTVRNSSGSLKKVLQKLEDIAPNSLGAFGIVSSYTAGKQWVLIRFNRQTGETWLADNSGWNTLSEIDELEISQYDVHLIRADQDKKGYVASRIDRRTGDTWWLNKKQWVVYQ
ncbi:MAG: hypothetical protein OFPII_10130 [Osedax symbiont Rs1]|nr:MAG: hypothetical protein OFPII_10130 [Osedax symbiont Rs1]